jgi:hypothetical protein
MLRKINKINKYHDKKIKSVIEKLVLEFKNEIKENIKQGSFSYYRSKNNSLLWSFNKEDVNKIWNEVILKLIKYYSYNI